VEQQHTVLDIALQQQQQAPQPRPAIAPPAALISLLSYDVDARMKMFGWLNRSTNIGCILSVCMHAYQI